MSAGFPSDMRLTMTLAEETVLRMGSMGMQFDAAVTIGRALAEMGLAQEALQRFQDAAKLVRGTTDRVRDPIDLVWEKLCINDGGWIAVPGTPLTPLISAMAQAGLIEEAQRVAESEPRACGRAAGFFCDNESVDRSKIRLRFL
jgi:hypothetical protein